MLEARACEQEKILIAKRPPVDKAREGRVIAVWKKGPFAHPAQIERGCRGRELKDGELFLV